MRTLSARIHQIHAILDEDIGPDPVPRKPMELISHSIFLQSGLTHYSGPSNIAGALAKVKEGTEAIVAVTVGPDGF